MKKILLLLHLCALSAFANSRLSPEAYMDSLQKAIQTAPNDSMKIISYMNVTYNGSNNTELIMKTLTAFTRYVEGIRDNRMRAFGWRKIGAVYHRRNYFDKALEFYIKAANLSEAMGDKAALANCFNNMGNAYTSKGDLTNNLMNFDRAIEYHLKGMQLRMEVKDSTQLVNSYNNIGIAYEKRGFYENALHYFMKADSIYSLKATGKTEDGLDMVRINIADTYYTMAKKTGKKEYYDKAAEMYNQRMLNVPFDVATDRNSSTLNRLGEINVMMGNFEKGLEYLHRALEMGIVLKNRNEIMEAAHTLAKAYEKKEDYKKASEFLHLYIETKDLLVNEKNMNNAEQLQVMFESSTKDREIEKLNQEKEIKEAVMARQRIILVSSVGGIVLLLLLGFLLLNRYKLKQKANVRLTKAYHKIELKNKQITDSINYAQRIQNAMLIPEATIRKSLADFFVFFRPRDIVSGDFYWFAERNGKKFFAVVDCTGHGVPGAFMSIIGNTLLNEIVNQKKVEDPGTILTLLDEGVKASLQQSGVDHLSQDDGMDISLCVTANGTLQFAGACHNLYLVHDGRLISYKGSIFSIGGYEQKKKKIFETYTIPVQPGAFVFFSTDGYYDQFGSRENGKFMASRFEEMLLGLEKKSVDEIKAAVVGNFESWKGPHRQIDDVLVAGFRIA